MTETPGKDKTQAPEDFTENAREGLRLMKAFLDITDPNERMLVIDFAERLARKERSKTN